MTRRQLYRWAGWFCAANAGLYLLVTLRYLPAWSWPDSTVATVYVVATVLGHVGLLAVALPFLVLGPLITVWPERRVVMPLAVLIATAGLVLLVLDSNLFVERRFHLSLLTAALFETSTWVFTGVISLIALAFESMLAGALGRQLVEHPGPAWGRPLAAVLVLCAMVSQGLHIGAEALGYSPVTSFTKLLPLYYPIRATKALAKFGWPSEERQRQARLLHKATAGASGELNYPLRPLQCAAPGGPGAPRTNVLWILIDALRPDAIDPVTSPTVADFRATGLSFANHWSGGNSSRMGLFSMFYGLPSTYWQSFYDLQRPPVLMDEFRRQGYAVMTSSAVGYGGPTLIDRTVFAGVPGLKPESEASGVEKNRAVTSEWQQWLGARQGTAPFFAFLYYDPPALHGSDAADLPVDGRYPGNAEAQTRWLQYRQSVHFADDEVARVLEALRAAGLEDSTLVMITSDHGYELDDLGLGYYGHASNFGQYQLRATLLMHWPGKPARVYQHRSAHQDLPATLLQGLFGCTNPPEEYSVGHNLFDGVSWDWLIAGSYHDYAIVEPERVMVSEPGGFAEVLGPDYRPPADARLNPQLIEASMRQMRLFYK